MTDFEDSIRSRMGEPFEVDPETMRKSPTDPRAVYGYPRMGGRDPPADVPLYKDSGALVDAIRNVSEGEMVKVNDRSFAPVVSTRPVETGEGFHFETDRGARYEVSPRNPSNNPPGTFDLPWIRRVPGYDSEGELHSLEVKWDRD